MSRLPGRILVAIGLAFAFTAAPVVASPITVTFEGVHPGDGSAGQYNWNSGNVVIPDLIYTPNGNGSSSANHFVTFCIERTQYISRNTTYSDYQFVPLENAPVPNPAMTSAVADAIRAMWAEYRDDLDLGSDRADRSVAFQNAVWHLLDPTYNPGFSSARLGYYNNFLNSSTWNSGRANLMVMASPTNQDQLVQFRAPPFHTPEPTTLVAGLLLAPALLLRFRRTRTNPV
jgi:hypothetical protein